MCVNLQPGAAPVVLAVSPKPQVMPGFYRRAWPSRKTFPMKTSYLHTLAALAISCFAVGAQADEAAQMQRGKQLFTSAAVPACAVCHTLKDAGAEGAIGPVLDELQPDAARVASGPGETALTRIPCGPISAAR